MDKKSEIKLAQAKIPAVPQANVKVAQQQKDKKAASAA
jgi:hypothetical protein